MKRWDLINYIAEQVEAKRYLEIGVESRMCFDQIKVENKESVDPNETEATHTLTSDEYFKSIKGTDEKFDVIFIDGLHESPQVHKDVTNSLNHLSDGGVIVCHDMLPISEDSQKVPRVQDIWNGDIWRDFVKLRTERDDLTMFTLQMDNGCSVICRGEQAVLDLEGLEITYENLTKNQSKWMVTKSPEFIYDFFKMYY